MTLCVCVHIHHLFILTIIIVGAPVEQKERFQINRGVTRVPVLELNCEVKLWEEYTSLVLHITINTQLFRVRVYRRDKRLFFKINVVFC